MAGMSAKPVTCARHGGAAGSGKFPDCSQADRFGRPPPAHLTCQQGTRDPREMSLTSSMNGAGIAPPAESRERSVLLLWMIFTGLSIFAGVLLWRYGLIGLMVRSDRTYISSVIVVLYVVTCVHCFWRTRAITR